MLTGQPNIVQRDLLFSYCRKDAVESRFLLVFKVCKSLDDAGYVFDAPMLLRDDSEAQKQERGLDATELGLQDVSRLDRSFEHGSLRDTPQTFDASMGRIVRVPRWV